MGAMSEMWDSAAAGWEANAAFVDEQLALATEALLEAAHIGQGDRVLDLAAGPGGAGLAAAQRVGSYRPRWESTTAPPGLDELRAGVSPGDSFGLRSLVITVQSATAHRREAALPQASQ